MKTIEKFLKEIYQNSRSLFKETKEHSLKVFETL